MGREATCQCDWAGTKAEVKALLETSELILRGEIRKKIPFAALKEVEAKADRLCFMIDGERIQLFLGKDQAAKWAAAIKAGPVPLAKKLGITDQSIVRTIGEASDEALQFALAQAAQISAKNPSLIVACVDTPKSLDAAIRKAESQLAKAVPIWLVYRKGPGHALNETMIRSALLPTGLVDTKVASVSATLTAIRFNLRRPK
jgi:hypothetical protein